jgi:hypothetical protein
LSLGVRAGASVIERMPLPCSMASTREIARSAGRLGDGDTWPEGTVPNVATPVGRPGSVSASAGLNGDPVEPEFFAEFCPDAQAVSGSEHSTIVTPAAIARHLMIAP